LKNSVEKYKFYFKKSKEFAIKKHFIKYNDLKMNNKIDYKGNNLIYEGEYNNENVILKEMQLNKDGFDDELFFYLCCDNEFIVECFGWSEFNNYKYLVFQKFESSLFKFIFKNKDTLTDKENIEICLKIAYCIKYLHNNQFIHRDIKSSNVLITKENNNIHIKLCDLGDVFLKG
jgi:serine/threonine protein kinase